MMPRPALRFAAFALLLTAIGPPVDASAHLGLVASSPAMGEQVSISTDRVRLVFGSELASLGNDVVVREPDGDEVSSGDAMAVGDTLEMHIDLTAPGRHTVSYRFVGQDGHAATGQLWFAAVAGGAPLPATAVPVSGSLPPADDPSTPWLLLLAGLTGALLLLHRTAAARTRKRAHTPQNP